MLKIHMSQMYLRQSTWSREIMKNDEFKKIQSIAIILRTKLEQI